MYRNTFNLNYATKPGYIRTLRQRISRQLTSYKKLLMSKMPKSLAWDKNWLKPRRRLMRKRYSLLSLKTILNRLSLRQALPRTTISKVFCSRTIKSSLSCDGLPSNSVPNTKEASWGILTPQADPVCLKSLKMHRLPTYLWKNPPG